MVFGRASISKSLLKSARARHGRRISACRPLSRFQAASPSHQEAQLHAANWNVVLPTACLNSADGQPRRRWLTSRHVTCIRADGAGKCRRRSSGRERIAEIHAPTAPCLGGSRTNAMSTRPKTRLASNRDAAIPVRPDRPAGPRASSSGNSAAYPFSTTARGRSCNRRNSTSTSRPAQLTLRHRLGDESPDIGTANASLWKAIHISPNAMSLGYRSSTHSRIGSWPACPLRYYVDDSSRLAADSTVVPSPCSKGFRSRAHISEHSDIAFHFMSLSIPTNSADFRSHTSATIGREIRVRASFA